jgi:hypothetical protein
LALELEEKGYGWLDGSLEGASALAGPSAAEGRIAG